MNYDNNVNSEMQNQNMQNLNMQNPNMQNLNMQNVNTNSWTPYPTQNQQQPYAMVYQKKKKPLYWLIPVLVFMVGVVSNVIGLTLNLLEVNSDFTNILFNTIFIICMFAFWPCLILAIVLQVKNK